MLLPTTATAVWVALIISLICWGSWTVFFKSAKKARFEFFAYDFGFGVVLAAIVAAYTFGSWNSSELTFQDNFILVSFRRIFAGFATGVVVNLANILLLAAVAVGGMSVAFPIAFGVAWAVLEIWAYFAGSGVNPALGLGGAVTVLIAVVLSIVAHSWNLQAKYAAAEAAPDRTKPVRKQSAAKAAILAILSGLVYAGFFLLIDRTTETEIGLSAYSVALVMSAGIFLSSLLIIPFFLNFPVRGQPLTVRRYFKIEKSHHLLGLLGGMVWTAGLIAGLTTEGIPENITLRPEATFMLMRSIPLVAALWGLLVWRETASSTTRVHMMTAAMFVLLLAGIGMMAVAPVYGR